MRYIPYTWNSKQSRSSHTIRTHRPPPPATVPPAGASAATAAAAGEWPGEPCPLPAFSALPPFPPRLLLELFDLALFDDLEDLADFTVPEELRLLLSRRSRVLSAAEEILLPARFRPNQNE